MRVLLTIVLGLTVIALALSVGVDRAEQPLEVVILDTTNSADRSHYALRHTPTFAVTGDSTSYVSRVWRSGTLDNVEKSLVDRLVGTNDSKRRDSIIEAIKEARHLRESIRKLDDEQIANSAAHTAAASADGEALRAALLEPSPETGTAKVRRSMGPHSVADSSRPQTPLPSARPADVTTGAVTTPVMGTRLSPVERALDWLLYAARKTMRPLLLAGAYLCVILLGILTGSLYELLDTQKRDKKIKLRYLLRQISTAGTWQGVIASPIVFGAILLFVAEREFSLPLAFLAYQNGFFWRATLKKYSELRTRTAETSPAAS